jgi:hypothetical protein
MWLQKQKTKKITWEGALPCARTITHDKDGGLPCAMVITHGKLACQGAYAKPGKGVCRVPAWWHTEKIQSLSCATMHAHDKPSFQENPKIFYKSLPCALLSSRQRFTVCNTRQTLPSGYPTSVSHRQSLFFRRVSSLTHGKASPCAKNLAVCKGKVRRGVVCRVFFAVSNTRQSLRRVLLRLCRVREAHGEPPESGSA